MKEFYNQGKYEQWIEFEGLAIRKWNCTCRRHSLWPFETCKHIKQIINSQNDKLPVSERWLILPAKSVIEMKKKWENSHLTGSQEDVMEENISQEI